MTSNGNCGNTMDDMDTGSNSCSQMQDEVEAAGETYKPDDDTRDANSTKSCIIKMLDEMERRVEKLRSDALKVEAERDDVMTTLDTLHNSQLVHNLDGIDLDEVTRYIKRLAQRSAAVRVEISTERSPSQQESLHLVNTLIDALIREVKTDVVMARRRCTSYMNSCSDGSEDTFQDLYGIDATFEAAVLGCTLEDQKRVKKRLSGLLSYFSTYSPSMSQIREEDDDEQLGNGAGRSSSSPASNSCL